MYVREHINLEHQGSVRIQTHDLLTSHYLNLYFPKLRIRYNQKSDIWALGCVLYELASLKKAFEAAVSNMQTFTIFSMLVKTN